ncbi:membrane protein [Novosphingobium malaysiense]|uniref:Membrane protein n=1 Tax=Novosphingobium malaysiense TaxID=1348853 RepID=A0A0B1ZRS8_9SPHN|nr:membrane protein [Novosphingobium malaysiense]
MLIFTAFAAPAQAQVIDEPVALDDTAPAGPLRVQAPPFVDPVPFINAEPPHLPKAVKAMIEEAIRRDDSEALAAVVKMALATQPYDKDEIRAMHRAYLDRKAQALAQRTQEETERIRNSGVLELWKGQLELGAFRSTGNTSNFGFTGALKLDRQGIDWEHTVLLNADYQKDSGTITREKYGASYQPRYTLRDGFFTYGRLQYEKNRIQGIHNRYSLSGGLGYRVLKRTNMNLSLEAGPAVRRTVFVEDPSETTWSVLTSLDFDWKVNGTLKLTQTASSYVGSDDSTFTSLTGIEAGVARGLKAKMSYSIAHETSPPDGALKTDTISRFSLVYGF